MAPVGGARELTFSIDDLPVLNHSQVYPADKSVLPPKVFEVARVRINAPGITYIEQMVYHVLGLNEIKDGIYVAFRAAISGDDTDSYPIGTIGVTNLKDVVEYHTLVPDRLRELPRQSP